MNNIIDYLKWRGDLTFDKDPFNEVDDLILSRFSYLLFNTINLKEYETIYSICIKLRNYNEKYFRIKSDKKLVDELIKSKRFKDLVVSDISIINDKNIVKQFGACIIHLNKRELYVSFMGTDSSLIGWEEDFDMSFMKDVPSQKEGLNYLKNIVKKYHKKVRLGGHSKGGNIAIYSYINLPKKYKNKILSVNSYDGPRFSYNYDKKLFDKVNTYIPEDSIFGKILIHNENQIVIYSTNKGIMEHDLYSWVINKNRIQRDSLTNKDIIFTNTLREWINNIDNNDKEIFVECLFKILSSTDILSINDLKENKLEKIRNIINSYNDLDDDKKDVIYNLYVDLFKRYFNNIAKNEKEIIKNRINEKIKDK